MVLLKVLIFLFLYSSVVFSWSLAPKYTDSVETIHETIDRFSELKNIFYKNRDHRLIFTEVYLNITKQIDLDLSNHRYQDSKWVEVIVVEFGNKYLKALRNFENGEFSKVPAPWLAAFKINETKSYKVSAQLLLGMNAHINNDLPYSLNTTFNNGFAPDLVKSDYFLMNKMFEEKVPEINNIIERQHNFLYSGDKGLKDYFVFKVLQSMREQAWKFGMGLNSSYARTRINTMIEMGRVSRKYSAYIINGHFFIPRY